MAGEGIRTPEQRALAACQQYMGQDAAVEIGLIPVLDMQAWASDVENVRLEPHHAFNAGWLEAEAAFATFRHDPQGRGNAHYAPTTLLERAKDRWEGVYRNPAATPQLRSRAQLARGSLEMYDMLVTDRETLRQEVFWEHQVAAAATLLKAYDRYKDAQLTHDLHVQTVMLLMLDYTELSNYLAIPTASRLQEADSENRYDMILLRVTPKGIWHNRMLVAAQEGGVFAGNIVVSPELLRNEGYEPKLGHGTLRALLENAQGKKRDRSMRSRHIKAAYTDLLGTVNDQLFEERGAMLNVDPVSGLDVAREWYKNLEPNYRLAPQDKTVLEECINAHEYALGSEDPMPEDVYQLGWLWSELASLPGEASGYERAVQVFELAAQTAAEHEDWPTYVESMLGMATAKIRNAISAGEFVTVEQTQEYCTHLIEVGEGMLNGFASIEADSPHALAMQSILRRLTTCLAINTAPELDYLATLPSPRQHAYGKPGGSDLHVAPLIGERYALHTAGRVRFADAETNTLDSGVATVALAKHGLTDWREELALLQSMVAAFRAAEWSEDSDSPLELDERVENVRLYLLENAALSMSVV